MVPLLNQINYTSQTLISTIQLNTSHHPHQKMSTDSTTATNYFPHKSEPSHLPISLSLSLQWQTKRKPKETVRFHLATTLTLVNSSLTQSLSPPLTTSCTSTDPFRTDAIKNLIFVGHGEAPSKLWAYCHGS